MDFSHKNNMIMLEDWISVDDYLPKVDEWVLVFEDDTENPQDVFINSMFNKINWRVTPARLRFIDNLGYPEWYLCYVGGGPAGQYRNVTHWMPMPLGPNYRDLNQLELFEDAPGHFWR